MLRVCVLGLPSGIGSATLERDTWPDHVNLRLHLRGLEELNISDGSVTIKASVLSHSGNRRLLRVVNDGQEKAVKAGSSYWTEIHAFDAKGEPVQGLPGAGGYFEMLLPKALLMEKPKSLTINWIDFCRQ